MRKIEAKPNRTNASEKKDDFGTAATDDKRFLPKFQKSLQKNIFKIALLVVSAAFIVIGILRGEHMTVLQKAVRICMECIGLG